MDKALNWLQESEVEKLLHQINNNRDAKKEVIDYILRAIPEIFYSGITRDNIVAYLHVVIALSAEEQLSSKVRYTSYSRIQIRL